MDTFRHLGACKEAQRLIQQALDTGATHLDLSHLRLRKLPEDLKLLARQLVSLDLSDCDSLIDIELVSSLYQLTHLDVSSCYSLSNFSQPGKIIIRLAGSQSSKLARHLLESITKTHHLGQLPEVSWLRGKPLEFRNEQQERKQAEPFSEIGPATKPPVKQPTIYFSYAWGK